MNKRFGIAIGVAAVIAIVSVISLGLDSTPLQKNHDKIGLVVNSPNTSISLRQLDNIYSDASSTGIGRSNVYLFWNLIEPQRGEFDWAQSDIIMGLNEKNDFKVTLFFSIINGEKLGPFPDWIGKPPINSIGEDRLVRVLDAILSRYPIVDSVIIAGETESQFRYYEQNIPMYKELFSKTYEQLKDRHPNVKFGNSFGLHHVLNKNLEPIVEELSIGDFVAFSYFPTDSLNEIVKTPQDAVKDLNRALELVPDKKIGLFEISWSTSDFVRGDASSQTTFLEQLFAFYSENEDNVEFLTWYRQYDRPEGSCVTDIQEIGQKSIDLGGGSGIGSSEYVIERLNHYVCNAGLIESNGNYKSGWNEFKNQIKLIN